MGEPRWWKPPDMCPPTPPPLPGPTCLHPRHCWWWLPPGHLKRPALNTKNPSPSSLFLFFLSAPLRGGGWVGVVHTPGGLGRKEGCTPGSWTPQRSWRGWLTEDSPVDSALLFTPDILTLLASIWRSSSLNYWDARFQTRAPHLCSR